MVVARYRAGTAAGSDDAVLADRVATLARRYADRYTFAVHLSSPSSSADGPSVTCYNTVDAAQVALAAADLAVATALDALLDRCAAPPAGAVVELTRRNELPVLGRGKSLVHFFYESAAARRAYAGAVRPLARTYAEYLTFTTIDGAEYGEAMLGALGLSSSARRGRLLLAVQNPATGAVYPWTGTGAYAHVDTADTADMAALAAAVERFLVEIIQGAIPPWTGDGGGHDEL